MKNATREFLQQILGFNNYLFLFSLYKIVTLKYDKGENDFLHFSNLIKEDGIILDIGANIGLMAVTLARKFPNSRVYAFEPIGCNLETLKKTTRYFGLENISIFGTALGNRNGTIDMVLPEIGASKMQGLCHVIDESIPKTSQGQTFTIPVKQLDEIEEIQKADKRIVGMKIDVEHFEWAVLEGARDMLSKHKPVIYCELAANENRLKSFDLLGRIGYKPFVVHNDKLTSFDENMHQNVNFIFMP